MNSKVKDLGRTGKGFKCIVNDPERGFRGWRNHSWKASSDGRLKCRRCKVVQGLAGF